MSSIHSHPRYILLKATLENALNLSRRGLTRSGRNLGDAMADIIAYGIVRNVDMGKDSDGNRLKPLKRKYRDWKIRKGFNQAILRMTDAMMHMRQVKGIVVVTKDKMTMTYGLNPIEQAKAEYAHEGKAGSNFSPGMPSLFQSWGRPPRPFYGITDQADKMIDQFCDAEIDALIMSLGARRK